MSQLSSNQRDKDMEEDKLKEEQLPNISKRSLKKVVLISN